jgi:hypothetical protein
MTKKNNVISKYLNRLASAVIEYEKVEKQRGIFPNSYDALYLYRGISKDFYKKNKEVKSYINFPVVIESSAARRLRENDKLSQDDFVQYHENLILEAKNRFTNSFGFHEYTHDLDVLAEIQHSRGATCLTDFTTNFLVALYFASCENQRDRGYVVLINANSDINSEYLYRIHELRPEYTIEKYLTKKIKRKDANYSLDKRFWLWKPSYINNRIRKQDSVFIFGLDQIVNEKNLTFKYVTVEKGDKNDIIIELDKYFNISRNNIYDDLQGFSGEANSSSITISNIILSGERCIEQIRNSYREGKYDKSLILCDQALLCLRSKKNACLKHCYKKDDSIDTLIYASEVLFYKGANYYSKNDKDLNSALAVLDEANTMIDKVFFNIINGVKWNEAEKNNISKELQKNRIEPLISSIKRYLIFTYYDLNDYSRTYDFIISILNNNELIKYCNNAISVYDYIVMAYEIALLAEPNELLTKVDNILSSYDIRSIGKYEYIILLFNYIRSILTSNEEKEEIDTDILRANETIKYRNIDNDNSMIVEEIVYWNFEDLLSRIEKDDKISISSKTNIKKEISRYSEIQEVLKTKKYSINMF